MSQGQRDFTEISREGQKGSRFQVGLYRIEQEMKARPQMSEKSTQMTFLSRCFACHLEFRKKGARVHGRKRALPAQARGWSRQYAKKTALEPGSARALILPYICSSSPSSGLDLFWEQFFMYTMGGGGRHPLCQAAVWVK